MPLNSTTIILCTPDFYCVICPVRILPKRSQTKKVHDRLHNNSRFARRSLSSACTVPLTTGTSRVCAHSWSSSWPPRRQKPFRPTIQTFPTSNASSGLTTTSASGETVFWVARSVSTRCRQMLRAEFMALLEQNPALLMDMFLARYDTSGRL